MNETTHPPEDTLANASREEIMSALFANMVIQQTNMAMMLLGKVAHPETGEFMQDVESAKMFIDQLEMLEEKTKGNLSKQEEGLMKQALTALRMAFVEAINSSGGQAQPQVEHGDSTPAATADSGAAPEAKHPEPTAAPAPTPAEPAATSPDESRKKFSKKY
ncbi:MAG: hypothetical protein JWQ71_4180 [Pedosphaera sp.]|nr:hypothetical protein [Pedosphaera sp.]